MEQFAVMDALVSLREVLGKERFMFASVSLIKLKRLLLKFIQISSWWPQLCG